MLFEWGEIIISGKRVIVIQKTPTTVQNEVNAYMTSHRSYLSHSWIVYLVTDSPRIGSESLFHTHTHYHHPTILFPFVWLLPLQGWLGNFLFLHDRFVFSHLLPLRKVIRMPRRPYFQICHSLSTQHRLYYLGNSCFFGSVKLPLSYHKSFLLRPCSPVGVRFSYAKLEMEYDVCFFLVTYT